MKSICRAVLTLLLCGAIQAQTFDLQGQINATCSAGGGTVNVPLGSYPAPTSMCSALNLVGQGRAQSEIVACPTTLFTSATSGAMLPVNGLNHISLRGMCLKNIGPGGGTALEFAWGQYIIAQELYIQGPFAVGISLAIPPNSTGSTISNTLRDIHMTGLAPNGVGCFLNSGAQTSKTVNNNYLHNVDCQGGQGGVGLEVIGGGSVPVINEDLIEGGEFTAPGGTGVWIQQGATRNFSMKGADIESSTIGLKVDAGQDGFTCTDCHISSNTTDTVIAAGSTRTFFTGNVGGAIENFGVDQFGNTRVNSLCLGIVGCDPGNINGGNDFAIEAAGNTVATFWTTGMVMHKSFTLLETDFAHLPSSPQEGMIQMCDDCGVGTGCHPPLNFVSSGALAIYVNGNWQCR